MKADIWFGAMAAITGITLFAATGALTAASAQEDQRIRIRMGDQTVTATLNDSEAALDLLAMLPLSIRMRDHLGREKTGPHVSDGFSAKAVQLKRSVLATWFGFHQDSSTGTGQRQPPR